MLELATVSPSPGIAAVLESRTDDELDELPYGVICVDADGVVLRYNLYESRLARLDRNQVVGRNFFHEIARCTQRPEFRGRFQQLVEQGEKVGASVRFAFVFDFAFGSQDVQIELARAPNAARYYMTVNRERVGPLRPDPDAALAARQLDLEDTAQRRGVMRDSWESRRVRVPASFFAALRATCDSLAPDSWAVFATEWGQQWGRRMAVELEASSLEEHHVSLADLPMGELARLAGRRWAGDGWGLAQFHFEHRAEGLLRVTMQRSVLAEAGPLRPAHESQQFACSIFAGCLSALLTHVAGRALTAREVACRATGAPECEHLVVAHERREHVDAALAAGARGADAVRAAMRAAAP